jgi:tetratricopeptide (TPR) repeat protein
LQAEKEKRIATAEQEAAERAAKVEEPDIFEQMKKQLVEPTTGLEGLTEGIEGIVKPVTGQALRPVTEQPEPNSPAAVVTRTGAAGVYKSFASFREDKFNNHIRSAEDYMKQGRFYRAADAYTLATAYKPNDPLGYAGKSIALFATGEYMSSSLFLARALEIFPEYAKVRVDLVSIIGDKDLVEKSILDAREWTTRSDSGELEFLLSYVYYQMDRMEFAKMMIAEASEKMPDSAAVMAMKKAIEERAGKQ